LQPREIKEKTGYRKERVREAGGARQKESLVRVLNSVECIAANEDKYEMNVPDAESQLRRC
jgi:hypothetical protein